MVIGKYYVTGAGEPFWNMAFDEWMFERVCRRKDSCGALLRLYSWESAAITIGYNQNLSTTVDLSLLEDDIPIIRRVTGGRAIYHDPTELTFSLMLDIEILPEGGRSLSKANERISRAVTDFLGRVGINAAWSERSDRSYSGRPAGHLKSCFGSVSKYEVLAGRHKIAGGAQRRIGTGLIHQGSIKLNGISDCPAIGQSGDFSEKKAAGSSEPQKHHEIGEISTTFAGVFSREFAIDFHPAQVAAEEPDEIETYKVFLRENCLGKRRFY
jgi:lipoate-protein ligase A